MLIVCMAVSLIGGVHGPPPGCWELSSQGGGDPPGPCRGQGGQDRGTMMQLRQPTAGTAYERSILYIYIHHDDGLYSS